MYALYQVGSTVVPFLKDINHKKDIDIICISTEDNYEKIAYSQNNFLFKYGVNNRCKIDFTYGKYIKKPLIYSRCFLFYSILIKGEEINEYRYYYLDVLNYPDDIFNKEISKYFKEFCVIFNRVPYKLYMFLMNYYIRKNKSFDLTKEQIDDIRYIYSCVTKESFYEERYQNIFNVINNIWGK